MRNLELPDQSWSADDVPDTANDTRNDDAGNDDDWQNRSFHYGG
jgi:hypothetical protein